MKTKFEIKLLTLAVFLFCLFLLHVQPLLAATCSEKYPDGACSPNCPTGQSEDNDATLCPTTAQKCCHQTAQSANVQLQIPIFEVTSTNNLPYYIATVYKYGLMVLVPVCIIIIIIAGFKWILAGGETGKIQEAKRNIILAFTGLFIGLFSYVILSSLGIGQLNINSLEYIEKQDLPDFSDYENLDQSTVAGGDFKKYTGPKNIVSANCDTISGIKSVQVDSSIKASLEKTCRDVKAAGFNIKAIGGYRVSKKCHGKGLAIDVNVPQNYCIDCYNKRGAKVGKLYEPGKDPLSLTQAAVSAFKKNGWCWGGDWRSFKDYMHFSLNCSRGECASACAYNFSMSTQANHAKCGNSYP